MKKYLLTTIFCLFLNTSANASIKSMLKDKELERDTYSCPTHSKEKLCKLVCATPGSAQHFVKSTIDKLILIFNLDKSFAVTGESLNASPQSLGPNEDFFGYFNKDTNCMIFGMQLEK
jgi:hypothetical protein